MSPPAPRAPASPPYTRSLGWGWAAGSRGMATISSTRPTTWAESVTAMGEVRRAATPPKKSAVP